MSKFESLHLSRVRISTYVESQDRNSWKKCISWQEPNVRLCDANELFLLLSYGISSPDNPRVFSKIRGREKALAPAGIFCNFIGLLPNTFNLFKTVGVYPQGLYQCFFSPSKTPWERGWLTGASVIQWILGW